MKIEKLESYLGKKVQVTLDDRTISGKLVKTQTDAVKDNPNLYYKPNFYCLLREDATASVLFRASYVKKVNELRGAE